MLIGPAGALRRHARTHPPSRRRARRAGAERALAADRLKHEQTLAHVRTLGRHAQRIVERVALGTKLYQGLAPDVANQTLARTARRGNRPRRMADLRPDCYAGICSNSQAKPADVKDRGTSHWTPAGYVSPDGEGPVLVSCRRGARSRLGDACRPM
jgi:hypothetical protein